VKSFICVRCNIEKFHTRKRQVCEDCLTEKRQCACGCGEMVIAGYRDIKFVHNHNHIGKITSEATKEKMSEVQRGKFRGGEAKGSIVTPEGYRAFTGMRGHPLAKKGVVYEHRYVLYDAIGEGPHPCHHCGKNLVDWNVIYVDHLDTDRINNHISNLVPSCQSCNVKRAYTAEQWSEIARERAKRRVAAK